MSSTFSGLPKAKWGRGDYFRKERKAREGEARWKGKGWVAERRQNFSLFSRFASGEPATAAVDTEGEVGELWAPASRPEAWHRGI